jgi:hypothetical protein
MRPTPGTSEPVARGVGDLLVMRIAGGLLLFLLAGLALFDKGFGYVGVPGVPLYISEITLGFGLLFIVLTPGSLRGFWRSRWLAPTMLLGWLAWGALTLGRSLSNPILDVLRDSALSYYALFALVAFALARCDPRFTPSGLLRMYGRLVPWILALSPVLLIVSSVPTLAEAGPKIPGTDVTFLGAHRPGNIGVHVAVAVVYLASSKRRDSWTVVGIVWGIMTLGLVGTQNRGGLVSGVALMIVAYALWGRRVRYHLVTVVAVLCTVGVIAWGLGLTFTAAGREISVSQLQQNIRSVISEQVASESAAGAQLRDTEEFRQQLWSLVLDATVAQGKLENGWGFGINLGSSLLPGHEDQDLRNPHNSHLTVLVRLGIVGLAIWIVMFLSWLTRVGRRARDAARHRLGPDDATGRLALLLVAMVTGMLVNAYADPSLETPMVAVWLWTAFGFGVAAIQLERTRRAPARAPHATLPHREVIAPTP